MPGHERDMETRHQAVPVARLQRRRAGVAVGDAPTLISRWNADRAESPVGAELVQGSEGSRLPLGRIRAAVGAEPSWWEDARAAGEQPRFRDSG